MIKINLLPQNAQKRNKAGSSGSGGNRGTLLIVVAALAMLAVNAVAGWVVLSSVFVAKNEMNDVKNKRDLISQQINKRMSEADRVRKFREVVTNQMDVLKSLDPPERILWCEKLNMLSNLVPPNVFLSEVQITEQVEMVETEASKAAHIKWERAEKKRGIEPQPVKRPLISYKMKVTGLALGKDSFEQMNNAMKFHHAMTTYIMKDSRGKAHRFMDGFNSNVDLGSIEATLYEGSPVNQFTFTLTTKVMGAEELRQPAERGPKQIAESTGASK